jgi:hypothetical protein
MISPHRIKYNGIFSNELNIPDLIMCVAMDSDNGETPSFLNREAVSSESHDGRYKRIHKFKYTETFAPKFTFFKKDFSNFEMDEVRIVLKWLTSKDTTALLETYYDDSNVVSWASIGGFVDLQTYKIANNRTIAITATWDSISPFALSELHTVTQDVTKEINTTMYYWTSTLISGTSIPQYVLTPAQTPVVGTQVYSVPSAISGSIITTTMTLYGAISKVNDDGSYVVNGTTFKLTTQGTKTKRTYDNKIIINIDTDDNKPVYPRITIRQNGSVVRIQDTITYASLVDMIDKVENTVYFNGSMYYWKTAVGTDPIAFYSNKANPNLATTSVKFINKHTDFFNKSQVLAPTIIKNNNPTETIVLDGANRVISSSSVNRIFDNDFVNWNWLPLLDGKNEITVEGNCTVTLEWREPRKIGEF